MNISLGPRPLPRFISQPWRKNLGGGLVNITCNKWLCACLRKAFNRRWVDHFLDLAFHFVGQYLYICPKHLSASGCGLSHELACVTYFVTLFSLTQNPFLDELFETLQTFCNIFIIQAEHLSQVCSEEPYVSWCHNRTWLPLVIHNQVGLLDG